MRVEARAVRVAALLLALPGIAPAPGESTPVTPKLNQPSEARALSRAFADTAKGTRFITLPK